jgi:hypothetical protein
MLTTASFFPAHVLGEVPVLSRPACRRHLPAVLFLLLASVSHAPAQEGYFLLMFGSQRTPPDPAQAHCFATFVRVRYNGPQPGVPVVEAHTISWLPENLHIRVGALLPEPGHNFELHQTLRYALAEGQRVSLWGPYQVAPELYWKARQQILLLQSGQVCYKAVDSLYRTDRVSNCIHAIGGAVDGHRVRVLLPGWGETASFVLLRRFSPWIVDPCQTHPWVGRALGLDGYPLVYRDFQPPRSGLFRGAVGRMTGEESAIRSSYGPPPR